MKLRLLGMSGLPCVISFQPNHHIRKRVSIILLASLILILSGCSLTALTASGSYAARAHFKAHCENDAGEFIYKTVENVEGVYQMRLRDTRDYISNLRSYAYGQEDLLEDPYGHTNAEAQHPHVLFVNPNYAPDGKDRYRYFETTKAPEENDIFLFKDYDTLPLETGEKYWRYTLARIEPDGNSFHAIFHAEQTSTLKSRYGYTWREVRDEKDKQYKIWGGELIVKDLTTDETLAVRRGYFYLRGNKYATICPLDKTHNTTYRFISKVLKPINKE